MKKIITILSLALAVTFSAQAQSSQNNITALTSAISVQVVTNGQTTQLVGTNGMSFFVVSVPDAAAAFLAGARKANETETAYVKRAFAYGANGLVEERKYYLAQSITLSNKLAQLQQTNAIAATAISNQLQVIKTKIQ